MPTNNISFPVISTEIIIADVDRKVAQNSEETLYDVLPNIRTKTIDYELTYTANIFLYMAGLKNEEDKLYECIKFRRSIIPKYKKKKYLFTHQIAREYELLYGFYLPVQVNMMRLISCSPYDNSIIYEGKSLQNKDGYVMFDNPIPMHIMKYYGLTLEYTLGWEWSKYEDEMLNKLFYPVFLCGMLDQDRRQMKIPNRIPILEEENIFLVEYKQEEQKTVEQQQQYLKDMMEFVKKYDIEHISMKKRIIYKLVRE